MPKWAPKISARRGLEIQTRPCTYFGAEKGAKLRTFPATGAENWCRNSLLGVLVGAASAALDLELGSWGSLVAF